MISDEEKIEIRKLLEESMTGSFLTRVKRNIQLSSFEKTKLEEASKEYKEEIEKRKKEIDDRIKLSKSLSEKRTKNEAIRGAILSEQREENKKIRDKYTLMISQVDLDRESIRRTVESSIKKKSDRTEENIQNLVNQMEIANRDKIRDLQKEREDKIEENRRKKEESEKLLLALSKTDKGSKDLNDKKSFGQSMAESFAKKFLGIGNFFKSISTGLFSAKVIQVGTIVVGKSIGGGGVSGGSFGSPDIDIDENGKKKKGKKIPVGNTGKPRGKFGKVLSFLNPMNLVKGTLSAPGMIKNIIKSVGGFIFKIATRFLGVIFGAFAFGKGAYDSFIGSDKKTFLGKLFDGLKGGLASIGEFLSFGLLTKEEILSGADVIGDKIKALLPDASALVNSIFNALGNVVKDSAAYLLSSLGFEELSKKVSEGDFNVDVVGWVGEKFKSLYSYFTGKDSIINQVMNGVSSFFSGMKDIFVGDGGLYDKLKNSLVLIKNTYYKFLKKASFGYLDFTGKSSEVTKLKESLNDGKKIKNENEINDLAQKKEQKLQKALEKSAEAMIISAKVNSMNQNSSTPTSVNNTSITYSTEISSKTKDSLRRNYY